MLPAYYSPDNEDGDCTFQSILHKLYWSFEVSTILAVKSSTRITKRAAAMGHDYVQEGMLGQGCTEWKLITIAGTVEPWSIYCS